MLVCTYWNYMYTHTHTHTHTHAHTHIHTYTHTRTYIERDREITRENYVISRIHEKAFRLDLSIQIKRPLLWRITYYELVFPVIYLYLVGLLDFFYYFPFFWALLVISHSAFLLCTHFKLNLKKLIIMIIMINIIVIQTYPLK